MSAAPLIEAVRRAGGTIRLRGGTLRLSASTPLPHELLDQLRGHKADLIDHLQREDQPELRAAPVDSQHKADPVAPGGTSAAWAAGIARLQNMPPPRTDPQHAWQHLITDATRFMDLWAAQAVALGWADWELFGCHRWAPWHRLDAMGLVLALQGRELAALTATEAVIRTARGAHLTHRRKPRDPLHPAERCLVWELG